LGSVHGRPFPALWLSLKSVSVIHCNPGAQGQPAGQASLQDVGAAGVLEFAAFAFLSLRSLGNCQVDVFASRFCLYAGCNTSHYEIYSESCT
jgi:hypothetical protein